MQFLRRIRSQSQSTKSSYAFLGASFLTGVIALMWIVSLSARFSTEEIVRDEAPKTNYANAVTDVISQAAVGFSQVLDQADPSKGSEIHGPAIEETSVPEAGTQEILTAASSSHPEKDVDDSQNPPPANEDAISDGADGGINHSASSTKPAPGREPRVVLIATTTSEVRE